MNPIVLYSVCLVLTAFSACSGIPIETTTHGRYIHMVQPYVHVHDNRELGKYVHIPNPYDGGYGPYSGLNNPYRHDESGNYDKYTTTSTTTRRPTTTTTTTVKPRLFNYYEEGGWRILRQEEEKAKHKYDFLYHTENGIYGEEKAHLHPDNGTSASGYYEYTGDDGELYRVNYKSDHRGFIPEGDHIPTPPPVPDAIKRALEYVAKKKETHGAVQSGRYEHRTEPVRRQNMPTIDRPLVPQQQPAQPRSLPALPTIPGLPALPSLPPLPTLAPIAAQPRFIQYSGQNQYDALPTIAPQNAPQRAYQLPSLSSQRPADQLIQQSQLTQQLPQVQVLLPQVEEKKPVVVEPVAVAKPVEVTEVIPVAKQEEQPQSDQPQPDEQPQSDQPQADQPAPSSDEQIEPSPKEETPISEEPQSSDDPLDMAQSEDSIVIVRPDSDEEELQNH